MTHDTPTAADLQEDLERQYAALAENHEATIFCPWCAKGNKAGMPACCVQFAEGVYAIGTRQLDSIQKQLRQVRLGHKRGIKCPYCQKYVTKKSSEHPADWVRPNVSPFCCDMMHNAALAISQRMAVEELSESKKRIEDGLN